MILGGFMNPIYSSTHLANSSGSNSSAEKKESAVVKLFMDTYHKYSKIPSIVNQVNSTILEIKDSPLITNEKTIALKSALFELIKESAEFKAIPKQRQDQMAREIESKLNEFIPPEKEAEKDVAAVTSQTPVRPSVPKKVKVEDLFSRYTHTDFKQRIYSSIVELKKIVTEMKEVKGIASFLDSQENAKEIVMQMTSGEKEQDKLLNFFEVKWSEFEKEALAKIESLSDEFIKKNEIDEKNLKTINKMLDPLMMYDSKGGIESLFTQVFEKTITSSKEKDPVSLLGKFFDYHDIGQKYKNGLEALKSVDVFLKSNKGASGLMPLVSKLRRLLDREPIQSEVFKKALQEKFNALAALTFQGVLNMDELSQFKKAYEPLRKAYDLNDIKIEMDVENDALLAAAAGAEEERKMNDPLEVIRAVFGDREADRIALIKDPVERQEAIIRLQSQF